MIWIMDIVDGRLPKILPCKISIFFHHCVLFFVFLNSEQSNQLIVMAISQLLPSNSIFRKFRKIEKNY